MIAKKGQGLSLNTIIIAIIVLVVLVVLVMIFTGYFGKIFTPSVKACSSQGGQCAAACNTGSLGNEISGAECQNKDLKCCASVKTEFQQRQEAAASCVIQGGSCEAALADDKSDLGCTDEDPATPCPKVACGDSKLSSIGTFDCGAKLCCK